MIFWRQAVWKSITSLGSIYFIALVTLSLFFLEKKLGIKLCLGIMLIYGVAVLIRLVYFKERPKKRASNNLLRKIDASSFPSIHAARAFFFAVTITRNYQNPLLGSLLFIIAVLIAYSRYRLHHHYAVDILGGAVLGLVTSYIVEIDWLISKVLGL